jgi:hypothetical protein
MSRRRFLSVFVALVFIVSFFGIGGAARAQDDATPVADGNPEWGQTCYIAPGEIEPVTLQAGEEAVTTFKDCVPTTVIQPISEDEPAEGADYESSRSVASEEPQYFTGGGSAQSDPLARFTTYSSVCHASQRIQDPINITLTHSEVIAKWYYNFTSVTGRSYSDSFTYESHFNDGWHVTDGPTFYWYYYLTTPIGAEGWTDFAGNGGLYAHEFRSIPYMDQYGGCTATFYYDGYTAEAFEYHQRVYVNGA